MNIILEQYLFILNIDLIFQRFKISKLVIFNIFNIQCNYINVLIFN